MPKICYAGILENPNSLDHKKNYCP